MAKTIDQNEQVGLKFSSDTLEPALRKILEKKYSFELIGNNTIILPRYVAEVFKRKSGFKCEEVEVISLFNLSREEANEIRSRALQKNKKGKNNETN